MNKTNKKTFLTLFAAGGCAVILFTFGFSNAGIYVAEPTLVLAATARAPQLLPETGKETKNFSVTPTAKVSIPQAHIKIDKIGVNAVVKNMGLTPGGAMAVPGNRFEAGLFSLGTHPGEEGSAVLGGHNRWDSAPGVFARLQELQYGDIVTYTDAQGVSIQFIVRETKTYAATDPDSGIFSSESGAHLNLITCSGTFDPVTGSYTTRLVIFTDKITS